MAAMAGSPAYSDYLDADPPPRALTPAMKRYLFHQTWRANKLFGIAVAIAFIPVTIFAVHRTGATAIAAAIFAAPLIPAVLLALRRRDQLRRVLVEGVQVPAQVAGGLHRTVKAAVVLQAHYSELDLILPDRQVHMTSVDAALQVLEPGCWIRVLSHRRFPDVVIPVVSIS